MEILHPFWVGVFIVVATSSMQAYQVISYRANFIKHFPIEAKEHGVPNLGSLLTGNFTQFPKNIINDYLHKARKKILFSFAFDAIGFMTLIIIIFTYGIPAV